MYLRSIILTITIALTILAASCGGDSDDGDASTETSTTSKSAAGESSATTSPDTSTTSESASTSVPLAATARGVTADTITIGVAVPDWAPLVAAGQPYNWGSAETAYQTFFDHLNEQDGVGGRDLQGVFAEFDFLDVVSQDGACLQLTQDNEVFFVMHGVLRDANLCFTELNATMLSTEGGLTAERVQRSTGAPWFSLGPREDAGLEITAAVLSDTGRLEGRTVGIVAANDNDASARALQAALADNGIDAQVEIASATPNDVDETRAAYAVIAERFTTSGVDFVFTVGDVAVVIESFDEAGLDVDYALSSGSLLAGIPTSMDDPTPADGAVAVSFLPDDDLWQDSEFQAQCVEPFRQAHPGLEAELEALPSQVDQASGEVAWVGPIRRACFDTLFFDAVAEEAGPELTPESFQAAVDRVGPINYPGWGDANYRSDKWDGLDSFYLQEFDVSVGDKGGVVVIDGPINVPR